MTGYAAVDYKLFGFKLSSRIVTLVKSRGCILYMYVRTYVVNVMTSYILPSYNSSYHMRASLGVYK